MAEEYQGNDYLSENENATAKAAGAQEEANAAGAKAADEAKAAIDAKRQANTKKDQDAQGAGQAQTTQSASNGGGLIGAVKSNVAAIKGSFKKGGEVPETGAYKLHKGEQVLPVQRASEYRKVFAQRGAEGKHKWGGK